MIKVPPAPAPHRRILGIDLGMRIGFAVLDAGLTSTISGSGIAELRPRPHYGARWAEADAVLRTLISAQNPDHVAVERVKRFASSSAARVYYGLSATLDRVLHDLGRPEALRVSPGTLKKRATGRGNASKEEVARAAEPWLGRAPRTDDESDAVFVAIAAAEELR